MKKTDPYKLLRIISLILGIICMLLMLKGKVFAAEMSDQDQNYIETLISGIDNYEDIETELNFVYQNFPFFVQYHTEYFDIVLFTSNSNISSRHCLIDDSGTSPTITSFWIWGFRGGTDRMYITSYDTSFTMSQAVTNPHSNNNKNEHIFEVQLVIQNYHDLTTPIKTASIGCFGIYDDDLANQTWSYQPKDFYTGELGLWSYTYNYNYFSSSDCRQNWVTSSTGNTYQNPFQLRGHDANNEYHFNGSYNYLQPGSNDGFSVFTNHNTYISSGNSLNTSDIYDNIVPNIEYPVIDTPRFNIYIELENNEKYLIFDYCEALIDVSGMNWYDPFNNYNATIILFFDLVLDGETYEMEFDNDQARYFVHGSGNTVKPQYFKIPFSTLLNGDDISLYNEAYVENVIVMWSYNLDATDTDYDFYHTSPFTLFNQIDNSSASAPGDDVPPVITSPITQTEWDHIIHDLNGGFIDGDTTSEFNSWLASLRPGTSYYLVQFAQGNKTWAEFLNDYIDVFVPDLIVDVCEYFNGITNKDEFIESMEQYIVNNAVGSMVDYLIFGYYGTDAGSSDNFIWFTYNTTEGRLHGLQFILNDNTEVIDKQYKLCQEFFKYYNDRLTNIDVNIYSLATENFNQNNTIISALNSLINKIKDLDTDLSGWLKKILDALQDLDIEIPEADYSSIISAINGVKTAIENQNSGNINSDAYNGYREWLFDIDNLDNYTSPHEYAIEVLSDVKGLFSFTNASGNETVARSLINEARLFIEFLNGSNPNNNNRYNIAIYNDYYDPHSMEGI